MAQSVSYSASEEMKLEAEQEAEIDGVDPWKAAMQGDLDALLQYIDDGGDVNQRDRDNNTPLHWACQESHFDIVGVLMSRNAAVDPVNDLQSTPLHYACREGNLDIVTGLINFNANLEARNKDNLSPLHVAAGMGHIEVTKRLLDNGAHMEAEDNALYTPLWRAAYYGHPEVVEVLLAKGANKLARNKKGRKPGDVFSPTVDEDKKERIKTMLGMGVAQQDAAPAVPPAAAAQPISSITASTSTAAVATTSVGVAGAGLRGGNGVVDSERGGGTATKSLPPPAFKPSSERNQPAPSAASITDSAYNYPDPSPANSPSSALLNSANTVMSDVLLSTALRTNDRRLGNGDGVGIHRGAGTGAGAGLSVSDEPSRAEGGVQTTPSVNGTVELNKLKNEVATKAAQLERLDKQVEDYKFKLQKTQTASAQELDKADEQADKMNRRIEEMETELEQKKREAREARTEVESMARINEERILKLQEELRSAQTKKSGCNCTIS